MESHLPKCTGPVVKVEILGKGGTSENENGAYHVCVLAPQTIADSAWPDWRYWTANDIISILDLISGMNKRTVVENDQSRTAGSINSVRRAVYVKEAIMQIG